MYEDRITNSWSLGTEDESSRGREQGTELRLASIHTVFVPKEDRLEFVFLATARISRSAILTQSGAASRCA